MPDSAHPFPLWGQFIAGCFVPSPIQNSPYAVCPRDLTRVGNPARGEGHGTWLWVPLAASLCPGPPFGTPSCELAPRTSTRGRRDAVSVSKRGQSGGARPRGSPEQASEGRWNGRTGLRETRRRGEAETPPAWRSCGRPDGRKRQVRREEGPLPGGQRSDKKFQTLTASFGEPET